MQLVNDVRPSPIAGTWYEADPRRLAAQVDAWLEAAPPPPAGRVYGVMAPHAGHRYSGAVAGAAFAALRGREPELVAVVAPMHYPYPQPLLTSAHAAYGTPLGPLPVDRKAVAALDAALRARLPFGLTAVSRDPEHALEIELPFLQRALAGDFALLPLMVRAQDAVTALALGEALAEVLAGREALLVASSDLSHYHNQGTANRLDAVFLDAVRSFSPRAVLMVVESGQAEACGFAPVAAVMQACRLLGAREAEILAYATSGDVTGDLSAVVGYAAAAFLG